ncbi:site-specific integrase [Nocardioides bruguierae]|uniref:site-specific integrase n=1 Tax=Nocardioides bruguierae TaxID=2945102 RepID=UPI0020209BE1|nr:site-specific integrase [Nocardioides bruguierae]MCL8027345.1 site-specific integrase [Nocardioides bruguierae]
MDETWLLPNWCRDLTGPNGEGWGDIVRLMVDTGLRISELFGAGHLAYVPERSVLMVIDTSTESGGRREYRGNRGKSKAAIREMMVIPQAEAPLERMLAIRERGLALEPARAARRATRNSKRTPNRPPEDLWTLIVNGEYGGFMSYGHWRKKLTVAQNASGVTYTAHELRHVFASLLYAAGLKEDAIAYQMGHSSPDVARRIYRHLFKISSSEVAKRVGTSAEIITAHERADAEAELADEDAPAYDPEDAE